MTSRQLNHHNKLSILLSSRLDFKTQALFSWEHNSSVEWLIQMVEDVKTSILYDEWDVWCSILLRDCVYIFIYLRVLWIEVRASETLVVSCFKLKPGASLFLIHVGSWDDHACMKDESKSVGIWIIHCNIQGEAHKVFVVLSGLFFCYAEGSNIRPVWNENIKRSRKRKIYSKCECRNLHSEDQQMTVCSDDCSREYRSVTRLKHIFQHGPLWRTACVCARKNIYIVAMETWNSATQEPAIHETLSVCVDYTVWPHKYDLWRCHINAQIKIKLERVLTAVFYGYRVMLNWFIVSKG